jgi:SAM-dependent methyltransferase
MNANVDIDYNRHYRRYHADTPDHVDRVAASSSRLLAKAGALALPRSVPALDIGCGMGFCLIALSRLGFKDALGIDISATQVSAAQRLGVKAEHVEDSERYLLDNAGRFGLITAFDLIEHLPIDRQLAMTRAMHAALAPDGMLVATVPNANSSWASRYRYIDWTHTSAFTEDSLTFVLETAGFARIQITDSDATRPRYPWLIRKQVIYWLLLRAFRSVRRMEAMLEFGGRRGLAIPLSLNLLVCARRT